MYNSSHLPQPEILTSATRLREFDALRGFSMLTVVFVHCLNCMDLGGTATIPGEIIITFFMPLFFFISGFFAYKEESKWEVVYCRRYILSKLKMLVICPIVFYGLLFYTRNANPIGWLDGGFKAYWFVIALFVMSIIYLGINIFCRLIKRQFSLAGMIIVSAIAFGMLSVHKLSPFLAEWLFGVRRTEQEPLASIC